MPPADITVDLPDRLVTALLAELDDRKARLLEAYAAVEDAIAAISRLRAIRLVPQGSDDHPVPAPSEALAAEPDVPSPTPPVPSPVSASAPQTLTRAPTVPPASVAPPPAPSRAPASEPLGELTAAIVAVLRRRGPCSSREIATHTGFTIPSVKRQLQFLKHRGQVCHEGQTNKSRWSLPASTPRRPPSESVLEVAWSGSAERAGQVPTLTEGKGAGSSLSGLHKLGL